MGVGVGIGKHTWGDINDFGRVHLYPGKKRLFPEAENIHQLIQPRPGGEGEEEKVHGVKEGEIT